MGQTLKNEKCKTVLSSFVVIVNESNGKPNKLWVDQGRQFYNKIMREWQGNNDVFNVPNI